MILTFDMLSPLASDLEAAHLTPWVKPLADGLARAQSHYQHGELAKWLTLIEGLPGDATEHINLVDSVSIGTAKQLSKNDAEHLTKQLMQLAPWRKGPYHLFGIHIDTEWRSDWKWDRVAPHLAPLEGRRVLDIGCGNGYHCWRMHGAGAKFVLGVDPSQKFLAQFLAIKRFAPSLPVHLLPIGIEHLPEDLTNHGFDTVFSMGVLYHRRSPIDHLMQLKRMVRPGGEIVLETLIVDGPKHYALLPRDRYAQMRNVWFLPSPDTLIDWAERCGYQNARIVDINQTSTEEQRATEWMTFHSLKDYLDPNDANKTREGYPAPTRAMLIADS